MYGHLLKKYNTKDRCEYTQLTYLPQKNSITPKTHFLMANLCNECRHLPYLGSQWPTAVYNEYYNNRILPYPGGRNKTGTRLL